MEKQRHGRIVESDLSRTALPLRQQQQVPAPGGNARHLIVLAALGLFLLGLVVAGVWIGVLSILDAIQGHPLASWHHVLAWLDGAKWFVLVPVVIFAGWKAFKAIDSHFAERRRVLAEVQAMEQQAHDQARDFQLRQEEIRQRDLENQRAMQIEMARLAQNYRIRTMELQQIPFSVQGVVDAMGQFQALPAVQVEQTRAALPPAGRRGAMSDLPMLPSKSEEEDEKPIPVPVAPDFWDIIDLITEESMPLCFVVDTDPQSRTYGQTIPAFGTILDLLSLCIIGKPGRGKSVLLLFYICILAKYGAEMHVLDPQGAFKELQLLHGKRLPAMPATARIYYYSSLEEMEAVVSNVLADIKDREKLYQPHVVDGELKVHTVKHPLVVMADELPIIAEMDVEIKQRAKEENKARKEEGLEQLQIRQVTNLVKTAVLAARKFGVYFVGASQSIDATILPTRVSAGFNSRIVFSSTEQKARMAGLESDVAKRLLPVIRRAGPGVTIYDCGRWDTPLVAAFPNMAIEDVLAYFGISMDELKALWIAELTAREQQSQARITGPLNDAPPPSQVVPSKKVTRRATLADAIEVWNESPVEIGRPRLRDELQARGLECSDDLAKNLLKAIKQRLESNGGGGGYEN